MILKQRRLFTGLTVGKFYPKLILYGEENAEIMDRDYGQGVKEGRSNSCSKFNPRQRFSEVGLFQGTMVSGPYFAYRSNAFVRS